MLNQLTLVVVLAMMASISLSCGSHPFGRYKLPPLVQGAKPDPSEDFSRLRDLFRKHGGDLATADDHSVTWKDTSLFRMFEFRNHTVVVFPYNWTAERYNVIIVAGHIKPKTNPFDAMNSRVVYHPTTRRWIEGVNWRFNESLRVVSFLGFHLGQAKDDVIEDQTSFIRRTYPDPQQQRIKIDMLTGWGGPSLGERDSVAFNFFYEDGKLAYMSFNSTKPHRAVTLTEYAIKGPVTPVESQGQFSIPGKE